MVNNKKNSITLNDDIEQVLSENYSIGSNNTPDNNLKVNKLDSKDNKSNLERKNKINERVELSSEKDIEIGLDLLVNKEKKNKDVEKKTENISNISKAYSINNNNDEILFESESVSKIESMVDNLNLDNVSKLSQDEIDLIIDKKDANRSHNLSPDLVSNTIPNNDFIDNSEVQSNNSILINNDNNTKQDKLSVNVSRDVKHNSKYNLNEQRKKKQEIIFKLEKMRRLGIQGIKKFNMSSDLSEMEDELNRVKHEREIESSIKFQRKCLIAFVTGTELLNNKFDFLDFKLDGWSEQVHENIDEYNEVFEELHEKYKERTKMAPEVKLLFMLGGSAFMYHVTNSMFKNSIPGMEDIMKQNPDLMKQFADAAINQMGNNEEKQAAQYMYNMSNSAKNNSNSNDIMSENGITSDIHNLSQQMGKKTSNSNNIDQLNTAFNNSPHIISAPVGVDEILDELRSNTEKEQSLSSNLSNESGKKNIRLKKGTKSKNKFNLNIG